MRWTTLTAVMGFADAGTALVQMPKPIRQMKSEREVETLVGPSSGLGNVTTAYFDQLIDHSRPELGTFKQRYYYNTMYYKGPGSPICMDAPVEVTLYEEDVDPSNATMPGFIARNIGGAVIALEHRYDGKSTPLEQDQYDAEHLQPMTLKNAVDDLVYFARNVKLPFDPQGLSHPDKAPWTLSGCSYSGALAAWTEKLAPRTYWAYEAGSAVVEARDNLWQYYRVIGEAMPKNCSADWKLVMAHIDKVLMHGSDAEKKDLKKNLGTEDLPDSIAAHIASAWVDGWQGQQYTTGYSNFFSTCDSIENQVPPSHRVPGPEGVGLEKALEGFFRTRKNNTAERRKTTLTEDEEIYENAWDWQLCNEPFQWWITERPGHPLHITTGYNTVEWAKKVFCYNQYPDVGKYKMGIEEDRDSTTVNRLTGGWEHTNTTRLIWVNADRDPWLYTTVSSPDRPGGPLQSTEQAPLYMLRGAAHCNDYHTKNAAVNEDARRMFDGVAHHMKKWAAEFYKIHNITRPE